jgi:hypothetical protein
MRLGWVEKLLVNFPLRGGLLVREKNALPYQQKYQQKFEIWTAVVI